MTTPEPPPSDDSPAPGEEWVDLIDHDDRVIGRATRRRVRGENLLHRGVGILCRTSSGDVHVHRRTATKDVFPSMYDMLVGGVVGSGESYEDAARREVAEELGIVGPEPRFLLRYLYEGPKNRSLVSVYEVTWDGPVTPQEEEVAWSGIWTLAELEREIARRDFVPDGLEIWRELRARPELF